MISLHACVSKNLRSRLNQHLATNDIILIPKNAAELENESAVAWWRLDPNSGEILGIGDRGWGQGSVEMVIMFSSASLLVAMACILGNMFSRTLVGPEYSLHSWKVALACSMGAPVAVFTVGSGLGFVFVLLAAAGLGIGMDDL